MTARPVPMAASRACNFFDAARRCKWLFLLLFHTLTILRQARATAPRWRQPDDQFLDIFGNASVLAGRLGSTRSFKVQVKENQ